MRVIFFDNGNTMCFNESGEQLPELQTSWLLLYCKFLTERGFDPTEIKFELPYGFGEARIFKTGTGYNWEVIRGG